MENTIEVNSMAGIAYHIKRLEIEVLDEKLKLRIMKLENDLQLLLDYFKLEKITTEPKTIFVKKK